jgi:AcrR family transcriptional regulator
MNNGVILREDVDLRRVVERTKAGAVGRPRGQTNCTLSADVELHQECKDVNAGQAASKEESMRNSPPPARPDQPTGGRGVARPGSPDGRTERGRQTRERIADAMLALLEEGETKFVAERIAERAGVSRRLVFHHYEDLSQLADAAITRRFEQLTAQVQPLPTQGPREVRVAALAEQRARILEWITPTRIAITRLDSPSERIHQLVRQTLEFARIRLAEVFAAELDPLPADRRTDLVNALDAVTTWSAWHHWRTLGLSPDQARHTMEAAVHALLRSADTADRPAG